VDSGASSITTIDYPSSADTFSFGINDAGEIVGTYGFGILDHGFLYAGGTFLGIDVPGAVETWAHDINSKGQIVGWYLDTSGSHGFLEKNGAFSTIDYPGSLKTLAYGINDNGAIVGEYENSTTLQFDGFLETPEASTPEPASWLLLAAPLGIAILLARRSTSMRVHA
jgi:uncharacterized membrane protein